MKNLNLIRIEMYLQLSTEENPGIHLEININKLANTYGLNQLQINEIEKGFKNLAIQLSNGMQKDIEGFLKSELNEIFGDIHEN